MNSSQGNDDDSSKLLIDWCSPESVINVTYNGNFINNPFDVLEVKAANMDPMHLVQNQTPLKEDPPCCNFLSPLWEEQVRQIRKSISLTDFDKFGKIVETNYSELVKVDSVEDKLQVCDTNVMCDSDNTFKQSNGNGNCIFADFSENIIKIDEEFNIESIFTQDLSKVNIEHKSLCNEEEKKQIRKQTRQRIEILIEKQKLLHKEKCSQKSFIFCTPKHRGKSYASLSIDKSLLNKGFLKNGSYQSPSSHFDSFSSSKISNVSFSISNNTSNDSLVFPFNALNSFDLNSLKPEWVVDNFSDSDTSIDDQTKDKFVSELGLANNCIETDESTPTGTKTVVKYLLTKKNSNKNPCLAYVPLQHMVQDNDENELKQPNRQSDDQPKPVAFSTPTTDTSIKSFSAESSFISRKSSLSRFSWPNLVESPKTPLNITKCIRKHSMNMLYDESGNTPVSTNVSNSRKPANKRSNSSTNLLNGAIERKTKIQKSFQLNKSKSEIIIGKISKPTVFNTNQISGLPVLKRSSMMFKGKENVKPE